MKRTESEYVTAAPAGPKFILETVKVIREPKEYVVGQSGQSIGAMIDDAIVQALNDGHELLDINLHWEREEWAKMVGHY